MTDRRSPEPDRDLALVIPVKEFSHAKSRLAVPVQQRRSIAARLAEHTIETVTACLPAGRVFVVTSEPAVEVRAREHGAVVVRDPGLGLNAASDAGRLAALELCAGVAVGVLVSDLPGLSHHDLTWLLSRPHWTTRPTFVPDSRGTGTTFASLPRDAHGTMTFGPHSALRFARQGFVRLDSAPTGLRNDLDTCEDLAGSPWASDRRADGGPRAAIIGQRS